MSVDSHPESPIQKPHKNKIETLNLLKPLIKVALIPQAFYSIVRLDWNGSSWNKQVYEIPELKQLVES